MFQGFVVVCRFGSSHGERYVHGAPHGGARALLYVWNVDAPERSQHVRGLLAVASGHH